MSGSLGEKQLFFRGTGRIEFIYHFRMDEVVLRTVHEQDRNLRFLHLFQRRGLSEGIAGPQFCDPTANIEERKIRQMEQVFQFVREHVPDRGIAAVVHHRDDVLRQILPRRHHHGAAAHGDAVQHDLRRAVPVQDQADPFQNVLPVQPAHADVPSLALPVGAEVRRQDVVSPLRVIRAVGIHVLPPSGVAVDGDHPVVTVLRRWKDFPHQPQAVIGDDLHILPLSLFQPGRGFLTDRSRREHHGGIRLRAGLRLRRHSRAGCGGPLQCERNKIIPRKQIRRQQNYDDCRDRNRNQPFPLRCFHHHSDTPTA